MKNKILILLIVCMIFLPISVNANEVLDIKAPSAILIEGKTGKVLYEKNADDKRPIASVTKVMTCLLIMEAIERGELKYDDIVTTSEYAYSMGGSQVYLEVGEKMTVDDMLKAIVVASGNDAAVAMAEHVSGSTKAFVAAMNERAKELNMNNTNFINVNGLDEDDHYSSARDVAIVSKELMKHKDIVKYSTIWMDSLRNGEFQLANTNKLIRQYDGATGLKTGFTSKSMHCLSATATRGNLDLIAVVLASPTSVDRFSDAKKLLDYGFNGFAVKDGVNKDEVIKDVPIKRGKLKTINAVAASDYSVLDEKSSKESIERVIEINENLVAPVKKGDIIGKLHFEKNGQNIGSVDLVAEIDVERKGYYDIFSTFLEMWLGIV